MKGYRPSIIRQKKRYSIKLAMERVRRKKSGKAITVQSNREEWIEHPRSLSDAINISDQIAMATDGWRKG